MYHEQSLQTPRPEKQRTLLPGKMVNRLAGLRTTSKAGKMQLFLTKAKDLKGHSYLATLGPIFLGISPGRSPAAPV